MKHTFSHFAWILSIAILLPSCGDDPINLNVFSLNDDISLGQELRDYVLANPNEFGPVLSESNYPTAYSELRRIRDNILNSGKLDHADDFDWEIRIIDNDSVLNAFAAPGGYIFVYTGLIKFLDNEDDFAGVLGHEMAHADRRHSTDQLTEVYGLTVLLSIVLGDASQGTIAQLGAGLLTLSFSRARESEADEFSVIYLCDTEYASNGAAGFFEKLLNGGQGVGIPEFLSTHPDPGNRVMDINQEAEDRSCSIDPNPNSRWSIFVNSLP